MNIQKYQVLNIWNNFNCSLIKHIKDHTKNSKKTKTFQLTNQKKLNMKYLKKSKVFVFYFYLDN